MSQIDELISKFQEVSNHPKKTILAAKAAGKKVVGMMPYYAPEEIVYAAGALPVGMFGAQNKEVSAARAFLPPFACSLMQVDMELQLDGTYDCLDSVIFSVPCDTLRCMSQKWHGKAPVIVFTQPQNRKIEATLPFLKAEYEHVKAELEKNLGVEISELAIQEAINVYNENRKVMREFVDVAAQYPQIFTPVKRHDVIKARWFMDKAEHTKLVRELIDAVKATPVEPWKGKKVILTGIMAEPDEFLDIFQEFSIAVVADDLAQESRQFRTDVPQGIDALEQLAKQWQDFDGCPLAMNVEKPRGQMLIDMTKKYGADAVVVCMFRFCDPEEFDFPIYKTEFEEAGVRYTTVDVDIESPSFEQVRTRIQAFAEMLSM